MADIIDSRFTTANGAAWVVRERGRNAFPYSQDFTNSAWIKQSLTVTADAATAPDGITTATEWTTDTLTDPGASSKRYRMYDMSAGGVLAGDVLTFSVHVKVVDETSLYVGDPDGPDAVRDLRIALTADRANGFSYWNCVTKSWESVDADHTAGQESLGDGWYRIWITFTATADDASHNYFFYVSNRISSVKADPYLEGGLKGYVWGAQVEFASAPTEYEATTGDALGGAMLDLVGGDRHMLLPGGTADPVLLDHDGEDYFWMPGTSGNNLTVPGLSAATAYDYKAFYEDGTDATGQETTDGSGNLVLGDAQTNFDNKSVTRIRVVADGDDVDTGTAVADLLASDADPDSDTFTEASSNAATVTINRSTTGYRTEVVDQPLYALATDDYLYADDDPVFDVGSGEDMTAVLVGRAHDNGVFQALLTKRENGVTVGWHLAIDGGARLRAEIDDGVEIQAQNVLGLDWDDAATNHKQYGFTFLRDDASNEFGAFVSGGTTDPATDTSGDLSNTDQLRIGSFGIGSNFGDIAVVGLATIKEALTAAEIAEVTAALISRNNGTYVANPEPPVEIAASTAAVFVSTSRASVLLPIPSQVAGSRATMPVTPYAPKPLPSPGTDFDPERAQELRRQIEMNLQDIAVEIARLQKFLPLARGSVTQEFAVGANTVKIVAPNAAVGDFVFTSLSGGNDLALSASVVSDQSVEISVFSSEAGPVTDTVFYQVLKSLSE